MNGLYLAASGAASQLGGLGTAADNLANLNTPGFRRFQSVIEAVNGNGTPYQFAASTRATIDLMQGPMQSTGDPLNVALSGPGFMEVQTPHGVAYTRNGTLQIASDGTLTASGYPLLNQTGAPINLGKGGNLVIGDDGSVSLSGIPSGRSRWVILPASPWSRRARASTGPQLAKRCRRRATARCTRDFSKAAPGRKWAPWFRCSA